MRALIDVMIAVQWSSFIICVYCGLLSTGAFVHSIKKETSALYDWKTTASDRVLFFTHPPSLGYLPCLYYWTVSIKQIDRNVSESTPRLVLSLPATMQLAIWTLLILNCYVWLVAMRSYSKLLAWGARVRAPTHILTHIIIHKLLGLNY